MDKISIRGARTHNLKNIDLDLPRDKLIVITGLSGSGKSSLAFDTIYAEGQRRYVESLSAYARQFLSMMEKPDIDHIEGLSPAISIEQKSTSHNPRSTVGTITEIYDYLRLLYARVGTPKCPTHDIALDAQTVSQMVDQLMALPDGTKIMVLAPIVQARKGEHTQLIQQLRSQGYIRARLDGEVVELDDMPKINPKQKHTLEVVVDRVKIRDGVQTRLAESLETCIGLADDLVQIASLDGDFEELLFSAKYACPHCGYSLNELEPRLFSFNNPAGACPTCDGLGSDMYFDPARIVKENISLADGAIRGWDRTTTYYFQMLTNLANVYEFDVEKPFKSLKKPAQNVILYGTGDVEIDFIFSTDRGSTVTRRHVFEGIIPNFERRYRETDSNAVRDDLSKYISNRSCPDCNGSRLRLEARNVFIDDHALAELTGLNIGQLVAFFESLSLTGQRGQIAEKIVKEVLERLNFLSNVGLEYLSLNRSAETLSGGEAQRIRLASQIGAGLVGVMYVLDEPSIGLHQRDNERLLGTLTRLRDLGNTVIVVEHDEDAIRAADHVVDIGPGAGVHGGEILVQGTPKQVEKCKTSITGDYLAGRRMIETPTKRIPVDKHRMLKLTKATGNNLKDVSVEIPLGLMTCITGVSGSGKSTLINDTLMKQLARVLNGASDSPAPFNKLDGIDQLDKVINIDQSPIGRTPRSNPATYTGLFTPIRELFSATPEARARGYKPGRFSFNVKGGRCEACQGDGVIKVEMHFLPDIYVPCDVCKGKRYNRETLDIHYKGKNIHEVLEMTIEDANKFFENIPVLARKLATLVDVGLSYICLGQSATTLSGGEAQRIKLARELSKRPTGKTIYILDEPTTGLHFQDIAHLLEVLLKLRSTGNSIVIIEHNLDVIKTADWVIDLGPEGGDGGGEIIAQGIPEDVAKVKRSYTGQFLKKLLAPASKPAKKRSRKKVEPA